MAHSTKIRISISKWLWSFLISLASAMGQWYISVVCRATYMSPFHALLTWQRWLPSCHGYGDRRSLLQYCPIDQTLKLSRQCDKFPPIKYFISLICMVWYSLELKFNGWTGSQNNILRIDMCSATDSILSSWMNTTPWQIHEMYRWYMYVLVFQEEYHHIGVTSQFTSTVCLTGCSE